MDIFVISSGMLAVALILNLLGSVLKYRTGTPNELIAVTGWDILHGIHRFRKNRRENATGKEGKKA